MQNPFKKAKFIECFCKKWQNNPPDKLDTFLIHTYGSMVCLLGRWKKMACCWLCRPNGVGRNQKPLLQTAQRNLSWGFFSCLLIAIDTFNHAFMTVFFLFFQCQDTRQDCRLHLTKTTDTKGHLIWEEFFSCFQIY